MKEIHDTWGKEIFPFLSADIEKQCHVSAVFEVEKHGTYRFVILIFHLEKSDYGSCSKQHETEVRLASRPIH